MHQCSRDDCMDIQYRRRHPLAMSAPVKRIAVLSDEFGQFIVVIRCRKCGHERRCEPETLARLLGWSAELKTVAQRMRCSACNHKQVSVEGVLPPRRSWAVDVKRD